MDIKRRLAISSVIALTAAGCAGLPATAAKVVATIETDLPAAANLYAIAKGIGEVALTTALAATPAGAAITAAISLGDALIAAGSATSAAVSSLTTATNTILASAAPAIKAVANAG